jgi:lipopolysaccharide/colanic/teichoic acid biosynthesis glycosyltransferase
MRTISDDPTPLPQSVNVQNRAKGTPPSPHPSFQWIELRSTPKRLGAYSWIKAGADRTIGLAMFLISLPLMVVAALLVRYTSSGPALYYQVRVGRAGRAFWIYKLRTMFHNCEAVAGAKWCSRNDARITPLGRWLRRLHIDELPQLWNVVRGDMSLVGPRPERPEFVEPLDKMIPGYRGRLVVRPGLTGLAQIQRPADTDVESVRKKLVLDLCYIERLGPSLDFRIMIGTLLYLAGMSYAGVGRSMRLPRGRLSVAMTDTVLE